MLECVQGTYGAIKGTGKGKGKGEKKRRREGGK